MSFVSSTFLLSPSLPPSLLRLSHSLTLLTFFPSQPIAKATDPFICHCYDCRKLTASMFASNFVVADEHTSFVRGKSYLSTYGIASTTTTGNKMTNHFCKECGTLMFRVGEGFPGTKIMRIGTVDDFSLQETVLKPRVEQFTKDRVGWLEGSERFGVKQCEGYAFAKL